MSPRCSHDTFAGGCRPCWLARHDARYRAAWGIEGPPEPIPEGSAFRPAKANREPCAHLGADTGDMAECDSCGGRVRLKVFACAVHGRCTTGKAVAGLACCVTCPDHVAGSLP